MGSGLLDRRRYDLGDQLGRRLSAYLIGRNPPESTGERVGAVLTTAPGIALVDIETRCGGTHPPPVDDQPGRCPERFCVCNGSCRHLCPPQSSTAELVTQLVPVRR